jgi:spore photoproduct lyase
MKQSNLKNLTIKPSGRSSDFISPSFIFGCGFECSYCYCKRHVNEQPVIYKNVGDILTSINNHSYFCEVEKPNQTHEKFITYDIGCNSDMALHLKHWDWKTVFDFFKEHPIAMGTFATKYVNKQLLEYNPEGKIRIRFSLMPQSYADVLEPNTTKIIDRIKAINDFIHAGYDVHVNFSPVIVKEGWLDDYRALFQELNTFVSFENKEKVLAEVIFLTHNEKKHFFNVEHKLPGEEWLWVPKIQETKTSQYGGENIRYKHTLKAEYIKNWMSVHDSVIPWNRVRYSL